jgi:4a-hydroxytetrahydrobiopterin dehydratase
VPEVLDAATVDAALRDRGIGWRREGDQLVKETRHQDFAASLEFVNRVGALAESANHHPDIDIRWNRVTLHLSTHSAGGLTDKDLSLATDIDKIG